MPTSINETRARSNRFKVTKRSVESLLADARPVVWYDDKLAGFGVRVMPSGRRYYFARYRNRYGRSALVHDRRARQDHGRRRPLKGAARPADGRRRRQRPFR